MTLLFVSGMFRSGTTTLARALNAHPAIACASDPMTELFKALRSEIAHDLGQDVPVMAPLTDYYYDPAGQAVFSTLMNEATLDRPLRVWSLEQLIERLVKRCTAYSGLLVPYLNRVNGATYREIVNSLLKQIRLAYGRDETQIVGFKEVWCNEFIPVLAHTYPSARFIIIQRDPRAVCASKKKQEEQYPWIFLGRQWRKLAAIHHILSSDPALENRLLGIRQENFLHAPEETTHHICDFLGIEWHPNIADPTAYKDGDGKPWRQNTSYGEGGQAFDRTAVERWRKVLTERETALIERICGPEMSLFDYEVTTPAEVRDASDLLVNPPRIPDSNLANWMRGIVPNDAATTASQIAVDTVRDTLLSAPFEEQASVPEDTVNAAFLSRRVLDDLNT